MEKPPNYQLPPLSHLRFYKVTNIIHECFNIASQSRIFAKPCNPIGMSGGLKVFKCCFEIVGPFSKKKALVAFNNENSLTPSLNVGSTGLMGDQHATM